MVSDDEVARLAFEKAAAIMLVLDADGTIQRINDRGCTVLGYDRAELLGADWFETVVPAESDVDLATVLEAVREGDEFDIHENVARTEEGEIRCIKWHVTGLRDDAGEVTHLLVSGSDVTERAETERRLRRYEQAIESSTNLLAAIDDAYTYLLTNSHYRELYGIDDVPAGAHVADVLGRDHFEEVKPHIDRTLDGESIEYETERSGPDGEQRAFHVRYFPLEDADGTIQGAVASLRDVTERRERERQLKREVDRLAEFAGVISHDLRNPLNVAQSRLTLAAEECDTDHEHLAPIERALDRMAAIIEDTLMLARQGEMVGETEPVRIADVVGQCWDAVATGEATLEIVDEFGVRADRDRLQHVFENLFRNSVEHAGGEATIRIGRLENGFYIEDDGPGIDPDDRERVFEPGFTTQERGTGFGLTIVRQIAEAHGWTVTVTDSESGGARFSFDGVEIVE